MTNKTVNFDIYGFDIKLYLNQNMATNNIEQAVNISPNQEFDASILGDKDIHFIYNLDYSGSMAEPITYENGKYYTRLDVCINSVIKSLEFLGKLADNGINIYITIVKFSNYAIVIKEFIKLKNKAIFDEIVNSLHEISPYCATNISESIIKIEDIEKQYISKCPTIYKILLSDGYSNQGLSSQEIKNNYNNYFNICIGIGNETQYDVDLLKTLSCETTERSCNSLEEIGDQIIDSVFGHMNIIAQNLQFNSTNKPCNIIGKIDDSNKKKLRVTSSEYCIYDTSDFEIIICNVSCEYLNMSGLPKSASKIQNYSSNHVNYGSIDVFYIKNQNTFDVIIKFSCNISCTSNYKMCKTTSKSFRIIQNFIHLSNVVTDLDMIKYDIHKRKKMIDSIFNKLLSCKNQIESNKLSDNFTYINTLIDKFITIFKPLRFSTDANTFTDINNFTPMRMLSAQSQSGSFACVGRQASMGYSTGYNYQGEDSHDNSENNPIMSPLMIPPPVSNTSHLHQIPPLYNNLQTHPGPPSIIVPTSPVLYPGASNIGSIGLFNLPNDTDEIVSALTPE